jgi:hypothetical protein
MGNSSHLGVAIVLDMRISAFLSAKSSNYEHADDAVDHSTHQKKTVYRIWFCFQNRVVGSRASASGFKGVGNHRFFISEGDQRVRQLLSRAAKARRRPVDVVVVVVNPDHRRIEQKLGKFLPQGSYRVVKR